MYAARSGTAASHMAPPNVASAAEAPLRPGAQHTANGQMDNTQLGAVALCPPDISHAMPNGRQEGEDDVHRALVRRCGDAGGETPRLFGA